MYTFYMFCKYTAWKIFVCVCEFVFCQVRPIKVTVWSMSVSQHSVCGHVMAVDEGKDQHPCWQTFSGSSLVKVMACCFCWRCFCSSSASFSWSKTSLHFTPHHTTAKKKLLKNKCPYNSLKKRKEKRSIKNWKWAFLLLSFLFSLLTEVKLDWSYNYHASNMCQQIAPIIRNLFKEQNKTKKT